MIKINLLLARKEKKRVGIRKEYVVLIISLVLLFVFFILIQWKIDKEKEEILVQISNTKKEISHYKTLIVFNIRCNRWRRDIAKTNLLKFVNSKDFDFGFGECGHED